MLTHLTTLIPKLTFMEYGTIFFIVLFAFLIGLFLGSNRD